MKQSLLIGLVATIALSSAAFAAEPRWKIGAPLVFEGESGASAPLKLSNPSVAYDGKRWHVFADGQGGAVQITFDDPAANPFKPLVRKLKLGPVYVPQVFYFRPQKRWQYLSQMRDDSGKYPKSRPMLSTNADINDPVGWSSPEPLEIPPPAAPADRPVAGWMDFYVICDEAEAHCFATSNDGRMWRSATKLADYPRGWSVPVVALDSEGIAWASHTYRSDQKNGDKYLTILAARPPAGADGKSGEQYERLYSAPSLQGPWKPVAATWENPFAGRVNIRWDDPRWGSQIVHCEPLLTGADERLILQEHIPGYIIHAGHYRASADAPLNSGPPTLGLLQPLAR